MRPDHDVTAVFGAVCDAVVEILDLDPQSLRPDTAVVLLGVDSLTAAEIIVETQSQLEIDIDFQRLARDWSQFSLWDLAAELARCVREPAASQ